MSTFIQLLFPPFIFLNFNLNENNQLLYAQKHQSHWWQNHSTMQSPPFRILRISNSIPDSQPTLLVNKDKRQQLLAPIPVTNPSNRAGQCGGEGEPKTKSTGSKKGRAPFTWDSAHIPHCTGEPDTTLPARTPVDNPDGDAFADTSQTLHGKAESKGRKNSLWQLLLQRNIMQQTHTTPVAVVPFSSPAYITSTQRIFCRVQHYSPRSSYHKLLGRKRLGKNYRPMILWI